MPPGRFWLGTIALTVSTAVLLALGIAILSSTAVVALGQNENQREAGKNQTITGVLTDAHCGARHTRKWQLSAADCTRLCVKEGSAWALVDGDKVYLLKGDSPYLDKLAGQRVRASGAIDGNTIQLQSLEPITPSGP